MSTPEPDQVAAMLAQIEVAADGLARHLDGPLLTLYYHDEAAIATDDIATLYCHLRRQGLTPDHPLPDLNVALHTLGGDARASYRLAQLLRDFAPKITFIIPERAYSGGTTIALAGDRIVLAHYAVLSPIDVGLVPPYADPETDTGGERLEPVAMDHYIAMAVNAKVRVEKELQGQGVANAVSAVDAALMTAMVANPENAMRIATYYRQRNVSETYARQLLENYMLKDAPPARVQSVIDGLITHAPDHEFDMDYHLCSSIGLAVSEANQELSDLSKALVLTLDFAADSNAICEREFNNSPERRPFFLYTPHSDTAAQPEGASQDGTDQPQCDQNHFGPVGAA